MAIYHIRAASGSRTGGQSAGAKWDYISRDGRYLLHQDQALFQESGNMPEWAQADPRLYWRAADEHERANGRLFQGLEFALPRELDQQQQIDLAKRFSRQLTCDVNGQYFPFSLAIHGGKGTNPHCHLMISERVNDGIARSPETWFRRAAPKGKDPAAGGARKTVDLRHKDWVIVVRQQWERAANRALEEAKRRERIDHRSLAEQRIERLPQVHRGPERRDEQYPWQEQRPPRPRPQWEQRIQAVDAANAELRAIGTDRAATQHEIKSAQAEIARLEALHQVRQTAIDEARKAQQERVQAGYEKRQAAREAAKIKTKQPEPLAPPATMPRVPAAPATPSRPPQTLPAPPALPPPPADRELPQQLQSLARWTTGAANANLDRLRWTARETPVGTTARHLWEKEHPDTVTAWREAQEQLAAADTALRLAADEHTAWWRTHTWMIVVVRFYQPKQLRDIDARIADAMQQAHAAKTKISRIDDRFRDESPSYEARAQEVAHAHRTLELVREYQPELREKWAQNDQRDPTATLNFIRQQQQYWCDVAAREQERDRRAAERAKKQEPQRSPQEPPARTAPQHPSYPQQGESVHDWTQRTTPKKQQRPERDDDYGPSR